MRSHWFRVSAIAVVSGLLVATSAYAASAPPPAAAFGAVPQTDDVVLSPDGSTVAWAETSGEKWTIKIFDIATRKVRHEQLIEAPMKLRSLAWTDDETLLIYLSAFMETPRMKKKRLEYFRILALDINTGATKVMLMTEGYRPWVTGSEVLALHTGKPKTIIMSTIDYDLGAHRQELGTHLAGHRSDSGWRLSLYEVDTRTGNGTLIEEGSPFTSAWVVDKNGQPVARSEWNPDGHVYRILAKNGLGWHEILHQQDRGELKLYGVSPDGSAVIAVGALDEGNARLMALPLDGSQARVLVEDPTREVDYVIRDLFTREPVAAVLGGEKITYYWLRPEDQKRFESVRKAFPDKDVSVYSASQDGQRVIAFVRGPSAPAIYYLVDFKMHRADIIGEEYPALAGATFGPAKSITYKARDGTAIPAYLTLPPGAEARNLPLIVLPHGGPEARDYPEFDWWAQFLATRGYAVLQPQFRGSTGFGNAFRLAGRRQWGGLMQDDVTDGVHALIEQGIADARRICIVGASYGGYAALAGAAFTPELYACAVSINGVSNLSDMLQYEEELGGSESDIVGHWRDLIGPRLDPSLAAHSPVKAAAQVRAPVLILYSADDTVVPPSQSQDMAHALKEQGKTVKVVELKGDDHWLSHSETRTQMLRELDAFLAAQLHN